MNGFLNDYFNIGRMFKEKRAYKQQMARVEALPEEYGYVFKKIQSYMWQFVSGAGYDMMEVQGELLDLFEEGAAFHRGVLEITGEDVAGFCRELLKNTKTYTEEQSKKFNEQILRKVGK